MKSTAYAVVAAGAAALVLPAFASSHATISASQPQTAPLTSARTAYVVRAPNEKDVQATWKLTMYVPAAVQEQISVRQTPGWTVRLDRVDTGKKSASGGKVFATRVISWTAKNRDEEVIPGMFAEFGVRFQNPADAQKLCFGMTQFYRNLDGSRNKPEKVQWTGPATAEFPASCIEIKAS
jgi:uncharacterized protein YcnI